MTSGPRLLVVAGSGRSGTSLFTGLTARLGYLVPQPEVATNQSNPRGFSEPRWAVGFHNELLSRARVALEDGRPHAWDRTAKVGRNRDVQARLRAWLATQFEESDRVAVKDPRLAWFIELYRTVAADLGVELSVATMLRDPVEVLRSREIAYGTTATNTMRAIAWINTMLGAEQRTRDLPRAVVAYAGLLADWRGALETADSGLRLGLLSGASVEQLAEADDLVDPSLRRSAASWDDIGLHRHTRDLLARVYEAYGDLVTTPVEAQATCRARLDQMHAEFVDLYEEAAEIVVHRTRARVEQERRKVRAAQAADPAPPSRRGRLAGLGRLLPGR